MIIPIGPNIAYQQFNIQLGAFNMRFKISWVTRAGYFVADIADVTGGHEVIITNGRVLLPRVNLLGGNINAAKYGIIDVIGGEATITNIGVTSALNWTPAA